jgi:WD40 repeat protein
VPDGKHILASSRGKPDAPLRMWDRQTGQEVPRFKEMPAGGAMALAISPDGKRVLAGGVDSGVYLWDLDSGRRLHLMKGHTQPVSCVAFTADGTRGVSTSMREGSLRAWDLATGAQLPINFQAVARGASCLVGVAGGRLLSGGMDSVVRLHDLGTGQELLALRPEPGHEKVAICSVAMGAGGSRILWYGNDGLVRVWDMGQQKVVRKFPVPKQMWVPAVAFSPDARRLLIGDRDNILRLWDVDGERELQSFAGHTGRVCHVAFSPGGRYAVSCGTEGVVRLWGLPEAPEPVGEVRRQP